MRPEDLWDIEDEYEEQYAKYAAAGSMAAKTQRLAVVSIARNAMPHLPNTLALVEELAGRFCSTQFYCFENDSKDETAKTLDDFAELRQWVTVEHGTLGGEDTRGFEPDRTHRLAHCRNKCRDWVEANAADANFVAVLDVDPHGGFSVDGVLNSVGWFCDLLGKSSPTFAPGAMASYSLYVQNKENANVTVVHYDAWAARLSWWEDRREKEGGNLWFHYLMPPVGSQPIPMNSAFGGLCLYTKDAFLSGRYAGGDCEHVSFHRAMRRAGYQLYLNPGSRYVAILP
jgi:hypothetical protein